MKLIAWVSLVLIAFVLLNIPFTEPNLRVLFAPLRVEDESLPSNATLELLDGQPSGEYGGQIHDQIA